MNDILQELNNKCNGTYFDKNNGILLFQGDCVEILPELTSVKTDVVKLCLTDPPYGINYSSNHRTSNDILGKVINNDKDLTVVEAALPFINELMADNTALYFFGHPNMIGENRKMLDKFWKYKNTLVWDKGDAGTFGDLEAGYSLNYESIFYYNKGRRKLNGSRPRTILRYDRTLLENRTMGDVTSDEFIEGLRTFYDYIPEDIRNHALEDIAEDIATKVMREVPKAQLRKDWSSRQDPVHATTKPVSILRLLIKYSSDAGDIVIDPFMGCYDDITEVLTENGWKLFKNLNKLEKLATRSTNGLLEYQTPSNYQEFDFDGDMIAFKSRSTDLLVTPNHNMLVSSHADFCAERAAGLIRADEMDLGVYRIPSRVTFTGKNDFTDEFMSLMGWYISEGYISGNQVYICQNSGIKQNTIIENLKGFNPRLSGDRKVVISLTPELKTFIEDNCGKLAEHKFISKLLLTQSNLKPMFDAMMLGDGTVTPTGQMQYFTCSKELADNFQELALKMGFDSSIRVRAPRSGTIRGREIKKENCFPQYVILIRTSANKKIFQKHKSLVKYTGKVYCATVPNHTLYVRRNGVTSWCGNSGTTGAAAKLEGRRFIGIEMSPHFYRVAQDRITNTRR